MAQDLFRPRADTVNGEFFVETRSTANAMAALWTLLGLSRQEPRPWIPTTVLAGESGSGRTTVATRFISATRRNASCDLLRERAPGALDPEAKRDAEALAHGARWTERMVREHGSCPAICHPAAWVPAHLIAQAVHESQSVHPAVKFRMDARPDRGEGQWMADRAIWRSPGNVAHHATRRTTIMMIDDADRIFSVAPSRRRQVLDQIQAWDEVVGHPLTVVLIGTPALADAVAESRTTQVIRIEPMADDPEFATVCGMIFGTRAPATVAALHRSSGGLVGRLVHIARMQGLAPPYNVRPDEIVRLPALPAPDAVPR